MRVAIIGAGRWGPNLINNFASQPESEVAWVIDRDLGRLAQVRERFPGVRTGETFEFAANDAEVDAIVIATPTSTHFELTRAALEAGKHVLVEKPMADNVADAAKLCEAAVQAGRVLMVGHVFVYNAASQWAKRYLTEGELGRIYYMSMVRTNLGPIRVDVNAAWDLAAHDVSLASYWLDADPLSASAVGGAWINPGVEDAVFATLRYPDDVIVHLQASWLSPRKARDITIVGERRMLTFDDLSLSEPLRIYDKRVSDERRQASFIDTFSSFRMMVRDGTVTVPEVSMTEPLRNECEHFAQCVLEGGTPLSGAREGLAVVRGLDAISRSLAEGGREIAVGAP